ncbi:MAG: 50S ribosomal protein L9 [Candidatus Margulisiibacteriota bacterium]
MKVILYKEVPKLGEEDSLVDVSAGYARNYLLPKKLAGPATVATLKALEKRQAERKKGMEAKRAELEELAKKLSSIEVLITADAGEGGKLFGSVTSQDIAAEASKLAGVDIDKRKIELDEPLKALGEYSVPIKLYQDIAAKIKVKVVSK